MFDSSVHFQNVPGKPRIRKKIMIITANYILILQRKNKNSPESKMKTQFYQNTEEKVLKPRPVQFTMGQQDRLQL